eukprot:NODE_311_length_10039_cov_0.864487.p9 type:complete len:170 gc:universal NODE_311_length_10039_cov_0.864487:8023-7514(-)
MMNPNSESNPSEYITFTIRHTFCSPELTFASNEVSNSFIYNIKKHTISQDGRVLISTSSSNLTFHKRIGIVKNASDEKICEIVPNNSIFKRIFVAQFKDQCYSLVFKSRRIKVYLGDTKDDIKVAELKPNLFGVVRLLKLRQNLDVAFIISLTMYVQKLITIQVAATIQ